MHISLDPGALVATIALVAGITIYSFLKSRHIEKMQQLQLGIPIHDQQNDFLPIKMGLLSIGIGVGILIAYIIDYMSLQDIDELYPAFIFLFGGLGLTLSYVVVNKAKEKE